MRIIALACSVALLVTVAVTPTLAQENTGHLKVKVNPGRAGVFIDGKYVGPAANFRVGRKYAVLSGDHEVRLSEPRYEDLVTKIRIEPGKTTTLKQTMRSVPVAQPPFGALRTFSSDKFAAVYVNGRYMGHADEFSNSAQGLKLNPGEYAVKIVPVGSDTGREENVKIEARKTSIVRYERQRR